MNFTLEELADFARRTKVFLSMPYYAGVTPTILEQEGRYTVHPTNEPFERREGFFAINEAALSPADHGNLYGDAVFEGIKVQDGRILVLKEHVQRWFNSAKALCLEFPYTQAEIIRIIHELVNRTLLSPTDRAYLRPVLTRGIGDMGVSYKKCLPPSLYIICSTVALYPPEFYSVGIPMAISRHIRRNNKRFLNPNLKTNNYLNNVQALLETRHSSALETLMLTEEGYVAEATADNIFVVSEEDGKVIVRVPASKYALIGVTRNLVIQCARAMGYDVIEDPCMLPSDLTGPGREVFITGTAAGIIPIISIDNNMIGNGKPGEHTMKLIAAVEESYKRYNYGLPLNASNAEIEEYINAPLAVSIDQETTV